MIAHRAPSFHHRKILPFGTAKERSIVVYKEEKLLIEILSKVFLGIEALEVKRIKGLEAVLFQPL